MNTTPQLLSKSKKYVPDIPKEVLNAGELGQLVFFVGAGASMLKGYPSWAGMADNALSFLQNRGLLNYAELNELTNLSDPRRKLSIADHIAHSNGINLHEQVKSLIRPRSNLSSSLYETIESISVPCVTTNYDDETKAKIVENPGSKPDEILRFYEKKDILPSSIRRGSVVHIHGYQEEPESIVLTEVDYFKHYEKPEVKFFLEELFKKYTVVFLGYGLEEIEILQYVFKTFDKRSPKSKSSSSSQKFLLLPFFESEFSLAEKMKSYYQEKYGVELIPYARDRKDYYQLADIVEGWAPQLKIEDTSDSSLMEILDEVAANE